MRVDRVKSELEILRLFLTISSAFFGTVVAGVIKNWGNLHGILITAGIVLAIFLAFFVGHCYINLITKAKLMENL